MPSTTPSFAVIGAGIAGLACARALSAAGLDVVVFDKGRRAGGRIATRRVEGPALATFDHGAAFFTVRDPRFAAAIAPLAAAGQVAPWGHAGRFVGVPGMSALPRGLAEGLDLRCSTRIARLERQGQAWRLRDELGATHGPFGAVAVAIPAPQASELLAEVDPALAAAARRAAYAPCWAILATWAAPLGLSFEVHEGGDGPIGWAAAEAARPGRPAGERWVLHASPAWSLAHLEATPEAVTGPLLDAFAALAGHALPAPAAVHAHRWRHARVTEALGTDCLDSGDGLVACGDWCLGPRVEGAWLSGLAAAERLIASGEPRTRRISPT